MSDDIFDMGEKDMTADGLKDEVKTQTPWYNQKLFSFDESQELKMRNVGRLFIVGYNSGDSVSQDWANYIWHVNENFAVDSRYVKSYGNKTKRMFAIHVNNKAIQRVHKLTSTEIISLKNHTTSTWNKL